MAREQFLTDAQWEKIEPLLPELKSRGRQWKDSREVLEGILWVLRSGARWKDLPDYYPSYSTCWRRLRMWEEDGTWERVWRSFLAELDENGWLDWDETFELPPGLVDTSAKGDTARGGVMAKRKRRQFTAEQKAEAVRLVKQVGNLSQVARDLDLHPNVLRNWVKQADVDAGRGPSSALTTAEKKEVQRLKRELKRVRMERDFLKRAAAFFAREESSKPSNWSRRRTAWTTPWSRASSERSSESSCTVRSGSHGIRRERPFTSTSRSSTIAGVGIRRWAKCAQLSTKGTTSRRLRKQLSEVSTDTGEAQAGNSSFLVRGSSVFRGGRRCH